MIYVNEQGGIQKVTNIIAIDYWTDDCDTVYEKFLMKAFNKPRPWNDSFNILNKYQLVDYQDLSKSLPVSIFKTPCIDSFDDLMDRRINQLLSQYNNLTLLWSGGCDSTAIVAGLLRNQVPRDRYKLICTSSAIAESPKFFQFLQKQNIEITYIGDASLYNFLNQDNSEIYINGCPEQIFMYPVTCTGVHDVYFHHWKNGIREINDIKNINLTNEQLDQLVDIFDEFIYTLRVPIAHTIDLLWLIAFSGMWNYAGTMFPSQLEFGAKYMSSYVEFFKTYQFAHWAATNSMQHYNALDWVDNPINYRREEKSYIKSVFDDDEITYKTKKYSQRVEDIKSVCQFVTIFHDDYDIVRIPKQYSSFIKTIVSK